MLYWKGASDICSGFWAFRKDAYKRMDIDAPHFSLEANFYVECVKKKLRLREVPITYGVRKGETKLTIAHGVRYRAIPPKEKDMNCFILRTSMPEFENAVSNSPEER